MCWMPEWQGSMMISQGHWPGFRAAGCNISIVIAVHDQRPIFGRTWAFLTDTPTDTYRYLSYMVECSLKDRPHTLINLIKFNLAISDRGSWPMNCWMLHQFHTFLDGHVQQEHKGRTSRHTQTTPAPAGNTHARAWVERTSPQSKTRASNPGLTRDQHSITTEQPLKPWSFQIVKTQEIQNLHYR